MEDTNLKYMSFIDVHNNPSGHLHLVNQVRAGIYYMGFATPV